MESGEWEEGEAESYESSEEPPQLVPLEERVSYPKETHKRSKSVPVSKKEFESDISSESVESEEVDVDEMSSSALDEAI